MLRLKTLRNMIGSFGGGFNNNSKFRKALPREAGANKSGAAGMKYILPSAHRRSYWRTNNSGAHL
jgi:hypothetical protein